MQRAVKILAALFATATAFMAMAVVFFLIALARDVRAGTLPLDNSHVFINSMIVTAALVFTFVYGVVARALWLRKNWRRACFFSGLAICFFPVGTVLGICSLVLLTRPAVKAGFSA